MLRRLRLMAATGLGTMVAVLALSTQVSAQTEGLKVGIFNADRILQESQAGQQALAQFNQLSTQRLEEFQAQQVGLDQLRQQLLAALPGSAEAGQLNRQLEDKTLMMQRLQQDVQNELAQRQDELTGVITQRIAQIIEDLGDEESFSMIINLVQSGIVYYAVDALDITDMIIARLDAPPAGGAN